MSRLIDLEEPQTKEHDPDYTEELGYDLPGAMSHPTSQNTIIHAIMYMLVLYFYANDL